MKKKAVVLLSGGLDSATVAAQALADGFDLYPLHVNYGQRHGLAEGRAAIMVATAMGLPFPKTISCPLTAWGGSALTDPAIDVPIEPTDGIPVTYVPARNTVLLALALSYAEALGARDVFIGVSSVDYSGYPDCRQAFIDNFELLADVATKAGVEGERWRIHAPLVHLSKTDTIRLGLSLGVDYDLTHSCYQPTAAGPCGVCDSCRIRDTAFKEIRTSA